MIIAICGLPGSGSSTIGRKLAKELKLDYFSVGKFFKEHSNFRKETEKSLDVWSTEKGKSKEFHKKIDRIQIEKAKKGNIVIDAKLSVFILNNIADFKIWINCSFDERARRVSKRDRISLNNVKEKLEAREEIEKKEWERIYEIDKNAQKEMADFVIDTTNLSEKDILDKILNFISSKQKNISSA